MTADNLRNVKIGFIGAGNMAKAIGGGLIKNGIVDKSQIVVTAPSRRNFEWWNDTVGAEWLDSSLEVCKSCHIIFLAMKPQVLGTALVDISQHFVDIRDKVWVSVLAGVTVKTLEQSLDASCACDPAVIRVMPNTPMLIGHGCSVFCGNSRVQRSDLDRIATILGSLGTTFEVKEEMIDSIASISGCAPAYMYVIIEAMSDAGVKMGVPRDLSYQLAAQAMSGAAQMVLQTARHPGQLKDDVCSPGGSTIVGYHVLEKHGIRAAMIEALEAAAAKNKELGKMAGQR